MKSSLSRRSWSAWLLALFVAYAAAATLAIEVPLGEGIVSPIWIPAGIAVAGLMLLGNRAWPAVFAGAALANVLGGASVPVALGIGLGNSAEALLAAWLLRRLAMRLQFDRSRDVIALSFAAVVASVPAATNGVLLLSISGAVDVSELGSQWLLWWFGDVIGILLATPLLLTIAHALRSGVRPAPARVAEFVAMIGLLAAASAVVFSDEEWRRPAVLLPMWAWVTLRFRALGASTGTFLVAMIGAYGSINGGVVIAGVTPTQSVQVLNVLVLVCGLSLLLIAAAVSERDEARRQVEAALEAEQQVARELRRLDELKDRLLAAVSHELRTPLTSILALSQLLYDDDQRLGPTKRREMNAHVLQEASRLDALLTDLLDVERVRMGMFAANLEDVDLAQVVRTVVDRHTADERPTRIELEPVRVRVDAAMVDRIVDNLVVNARRHTPHGSTTFVRVKRHAGGALIMVEDEGSGVHDDDKSAIFEPFNRGESSVTDAPGTGIGLSLVLQFTKLHGGNAWVEDRPGGGASFRVFLPGGERPVEM